MIATTGYNDRNELVVQIPEEIITKLQWKAGDEVEISLEGDEIVVTKV